MRLFFSVMWAFVLACGSPVSGVDGGVTDGAVDAGEADGGMDGGMDGGAGDGGEDCNAGYVPGPEVALTERGPVRGEVTDGGRAFRGLPYVKPPVGARRWRPPEPDFTCWSGVRDATAFGAWCPQLEQAQGVPFDAGAPVKGDEDCLTLNVFTPSSVAPDAGLPVLFFLHGGGNTLGAASVQAAPGVFLYDGAALAQRGNVVVVTAQYRLGALGFLSMPALDAESDAGVSGNYGLLDQQEALRWVQRNIRAFGGDPTRVLLFGESAGAVDTCMHLGMPASRGLFHRALVQSGSCTSAAPVDARRMEAATWLAGTGCAQATDQAACLRALTPEQLIRAYPVEVVVGQRRGVVSWGPTADGVVLPQRPVDALLAGTGHPVPLVVGSNLDETALSMPLITTEAEYRAAVAAALGPALVDEVLQRYPVATYGTPRRALVQVTTDAFFGCQARLSARAAARGQPQAPVYRYLFARAPVPARGAFHGIELAYVFQKVMELQATPQADDLAVEASVLSLWTRFAATGDPTGGAGAWPRYDASETLLRLDATSTTVSGWRSSECDFWDGVVGFNVPPPP
ncbi:MAG: carboxylesterase family protein [Myxococcota bacterium]